MRYLLGVQCIAHDQALGLAQIGSLTVPPDARYASVANNYKEWSLLARGAD